MDKVLVKLSRARSIEPGDHSVEVDGGRVLSVPPISIRHYPIRTYLAFESKVRMIEEFFLVNPQLPPGRGLHWSRWVKVMKAGNLEKEFEDQFIAADEITDE